MLTSFFGKGKFMRNTLRYTFDCITKKIKMFLFRYLISGITNGAQWYPIYGGMQDYNYLFTNTFEVLVEMACCKFPLQNKLSKFWNDHKQSLINYIKLVHMGIKGSIRSVLGESDLSTPIYR